TMLRHLDWLTKEHIKVLGICNVALTIPGRIIVGILIDRYGPRRVFGWLMITMSVPVFAFALGNTFIQLLISRLVLSVIGAGFVVGIRMVSDWFPPKMIGRAEGFYAGWGNFGSAWAAMTLPWIALSVFGAYEDGWRYALLLNGLVSLVYGVMYMRLVKDMPDGAKFHGAKKVQPMEVSSWFDLFQFIVWSAPLMGALALLAWRLSTIKLGGSDVAFLSPTILYLTWGVLGAVYVAHVVKTLQVNVPLLRAGVPEEEKYSFANVAVLNTTYFANFGAELAVVSMLPAFFEGVFSISPTAAGMVAASFAFVNLFARPLGGLVSDMLGSRKLVMLIYMVGIALGFLGMAYINASWPIWIAVVLTIACSMFVQGAEGATFAVIPFIKRRMTGQIAGMAGAYGNVGAVCYLVIYSMVDAKTFFLILSACAGISFLCCLLFMTEPKGSFADEFDMDHMAEDEEGHLIEEEPGA
ncbi:MAG: MFS transporter, partial [Candidatus Hydrogenedentes bacterium]|nr:MFS transporter [Candidatus Hydrogenedentota bacterium]